MERGERGEISGSEMLTEEQRQANDLRVELISMVADPDHDSEKIVQIAERLIALLDSPENDSMSDELKEEHREEYRKIIQIEEARKS